MMIQTSQTNQCFIAHSYDSPSQDILLSVCSKLLPTYKLEPWYSALHEDKYQAIKNVEYHIDQSPLDKIIGMIAESRYGIYDLTMWEDRFGKHLARNVFIELGIAIGLNRPTLLLYQNKSECMPIPEILQGLDIVRFSGETTLQNELEKRLPKWLNSNPEQEWWNRYCINGQRSCNFREVSSCHPNWRATTIRNHIVDGNDADRTDFRSVITEIINQYSNNAITYAENISVDTEYRLQICGVCQACRNSAISVYRLTKDTISEAYLGIGIDLAQERQFEIKKPKLFLAESMCYVPSLLTKYEILLAQNDVDLRKRLKIAIPRILDAVRKTIWKPRILPFIELIHVSNQIQENNESDTQISNQPPVSNLELPNQGGILQGVIASISTLQIIVNIGHENKGLIIGTELEQIPVSEREALKVGQEIPVYVINPGDQSGNVVLSYMRAREAMGWDLVEKMQESDESFEGTIDGYNKGGLIVLIHGLRGFIPASQISIARRSLVQGETPERWAKMIGETISVRIIEVDRARRRLILSERAANSESRQSLRERVIEGLEEGQVYTGRVTSVADFGAFVNVNGADGLVHLSELSWKRIKHPSEVLEVGQEVKVKVISVNKEKKRIGLSIRAAEENEGENRLPPKNNGSIKEPSAFGIIRRKKSNQEQFLLQFVPSWNALNLIGGKMNFLADGNDFSITLRRELAEELGLDIKDYVITKEYDSIQFSQFSKRDSVNKQYEFHLYEASISKEASNLIKTQDENGPNLNSRWNYWASLSEIKNLKTINGIEISETTRKIFQHLNILN